MEAQVKTVVKDVAGKDLCDVYAVGISPDNRRLVVVSKENISIVNTQTGEVLREHPRTVAAGSTGEIHAVNFSPDGVYVILAAKNKTAYVLDSRTCSCWLHLAGVHAGAILDASFSSDGALVVLASADGTASTYKWSARADELQFHLKHDKTGDKPCHTAAINAASFSPDCGRLVLGSSDMTASIWDVRTGELLRHFKDNGHRGAILAAAFSPHGTWIVLGSADGKASGVDASGQKPPDAEDVTDQYWIRDYNSGEISAARFSPDGARVVLSCKGMALVVDAYGDGCRVVTAAEKSVLMEHGGPVLDAFFSPDGRRVVTVSETSVSLTTLQVRLFHHRHPSPRPAACLACILHDDITMCHSF